MIHSDEIELHHAPPAPLECIRGRKRISIFSGEKSIILGVAREDFPRNPGKGAFL